MNQRNLSRLTHWFGNLGLVFTFVVSTSTSAGLGQLMQPEHEHDSIGVGGGQVIPPTPFLLAEAAKLTASFNTGPRTADTYPKHLPFQILYQSFNPADINNTGGLYTTFNVKRGTFLYVPVIYNDNSLPIIGDFPPAGDRRALLHYLYSQDEFGLVYTRITVDGKVTSLGPGYPVEVSFKNPLPDGATLYQTVAAFLVPLTKGTHSVEISALATGEAFSEPPFPDYFPGGVFQFSTTYTVVVE